METSTWMRLRSSGGSDFAQLKKGANQIGSGRLYSKLLSAVPLPSVCTRSRLLVQMAPPVEVRSICSWPRQPARKRTRVARGSSSVWVIANIRRKTAAWRDRIMLCQLDWLPTSFYFALAGGTMSFIRRYSTIWP